MTVQELIDELNQIEDKGATAKISYDTGMAKDDIQGIYIEPKYGTVYITSVN
jgi:hypothetical protein